MKTEINYDILFNKDSSNQINNVINSYFLDNELEPMTFLPNTNLINIIIGTNNSGKSRFMRNLMKCKSLIGVRNLRKVNELVKEYNAYVIKFNKDYIDDPKKKYENSGSQSFNLRGIDEIKERLDFLNANKLFELDVSDLSGYISLYNQFQKNIDNLLKLQEKGVSDIYFKEFKGIDAFTVKDFQSPECYYIPTLRSAHSLFQREGDSYSKIENDIFLDTLNRYYNFEGKDVQIFTGLHLYKEILNSRNSKRSVRQSLKILKNLLV